MVRIEVRGRIWTSGPGASCAPCPTCQSTAAPPPQTCVAAVRSGPDNSRRAFDETGRALREEEKKRIAVTVKLHMAGLSSIERYVHAQKEQGKQMGRVGDACGDFSVRRLRAVRVELCSGGEASGRCSGLPRPQRSSVMAHLDRNCKRSPELLLACLAVAAFDSAAVERRYRQKRC